MSGIVSAPPLGHLCKMYCIRPGKMTSRSARYLSSMCPSTSCSVMRPLHEESASECVHRFVLRCRLMSKSPLVECWYFRILDFLGNSESKINYIVGLSSIRACSMNLASRQSTPIRIYFCIDSFRYVSYQIIPKDSAHFALWISRNLPFCGCISSGSVT